MSGRERRAFKRYVIDGLNVEIAGVLHETADVSKCAVAVIRQPGVNYEMPLGDIKFKCERAPELNKPLKNVRYLAQRRFIAILEYEMADPKWESRLAALDVRSDVAPFVSIPELA